MSGIPFNLHSLLPQRGPLDAFCNAASEPEAFSAAFIWGTLLFSGLVFFWVLYQWAAVWKKTQFILDSLKGVTSENAAEQRQRLCQRGGPLWLEFDASLIEELDPLTHTIRLRRTVDAAHIFNERTLARQLIHSRLITATPGLLTAVGILGAFAGLQLGLSGLDLTSGHIEQSIPGLVKSLSIKFSTSIWGIFCSIIFNILEKFVEAGAWSRIHCVQSRIDRLFPRFTPETTLSRLQISSGESEKILRGLAAAIAGEMHQAIGPGRMEESLGRIGDNHNRQFVELSDRLTAAFECLQAPIAQLSAALCRQDAMMENLRDVLANLPEQVRSLETDRRIGDSQRQTTMHEITADLAQTIQRAVEQLSGHSQVADSLRAAAGQMAESTRNLELFSVRLGDAATKQEQATAAAENAAASNARVATALEALPNQIELASGGLTQAADSIRQTAKSTTQGYSQLAAQQHQFVQDLADGLGQFATRISEVLQIYGDDVQAQTRDRIRQFAEETAGILNRLADLESDLKTDIETVESLLQQK